MVNLMKLSYWFLLKFSSMKLVANGQFNETLILAFAKLVLVFANGQFNETLILVFAKVQFNETCISLC